MRIVIVGSGASAMMASWAARAHDVLCVSPSGQFGGQFGIGPWRVVEATEQMQGLLDQVGVPYAVSTCPSHPAVWIDVCDRPVILHVPDDFAEVPSRDLDVMASAYSLKYDLINDPAIPGLREPEWRQHSYLDFDFDLLVGAIADDTDIAAGSLIRVDVDRRRAHFMTPDGESIEPYDLLIVTCPIAEFARAIIHDPRYSCPVHWTSTIDLAFVEAPIRGTAQVPDPLLAADTIWCPYLPTVMRMSHALSGESKESAYVVEFKANESIERLSMDLDRVLGKSYRVTRLVRGVRGPVVPDLSEPWSLTQKAIRPLGPHATGIMASISTTLEEAIAMIDRR